MTEPHTEDADHAAAPAHDGAATETDATTPADASALDGERAANAAADDGNDDAGRSDDEAAAPSAGTQTGEGGASLAGALAEFSEQLRESNRISEERERIIDRLHQENQKLKQGEVQQTLLPVFRDLIRLYDDLQTTAASYAARDGGEKINSELTCYRETVGDILYRYGVEQIEVAVGDGFNPKEHKAVATAPAPDAGHDRTVSKIIRDGFKTDTRIIRNAEVEVYRHVAPAPPPATAPEGENQEAR